jgi:hypothetical protein
VYAKIVQVVVCLNENFRFSGFAGLLPVISWVLGCNSLIINGIQFCWLHAFAGRYCGDYWLYSFC